MSVIPPQMAAVDQSKEPNPNQIRIKSKSNPNETWAGRLENNEGSQRNPDGDERDLAVA